MKGSIRHQYWLKWGLGSIGVNLLLILIFCVANRLFPTAPPGDHELARLRFLVYPSLPLLSFAII